MVKKTAFSEEGMHAWASFMRESQALLAGVEADLKQAGLPALLWYDVLLELERAGTDGLRPYQLRQETLLTQYNVSRLVKRLVEAGLVAVLECEDDGRGQILRITTAGNQLRKRMWPVYQSAVESRFTAKLSGRDITLLQDLLGKLA